jgi:hypothetical protein
MISVRRRPVTQRHASVTIGWWCACGRTLAEFPPCAVFSHRDRFASSRAALSGSSARSQPRHGLQMHSRGMTLVAHLLATAGTLAAVVLLLLMAVVPLLLDLPLRPTSKGR